jgi:hypothetical protein
MDFSFRMCGRVETGRYQRYRLPPLFSAVAHRSLAVSDMGEAFIAPEICASEAEFSGTP